MTNPAFSLSPLVVVDRAIGDFRRGIPVLITGGGLAVMATPAELLGGELADALKAWVRGPDAQGPYLALTHHRAATLKIRRYTPEIVLLPHTDWPSAEAARALADPSLDLSFPLRGPFHSLRTSLDAMGGEGWMASVKLAKLAQLLPAIAGVALSPGRGAELARVYNLLSVSAAEILAYDTNAAGSLVQVAGARVPLIDAEHARLLAFRPADGGVEHLAIIIGDPDRHQPVLARLHSECFTGDLIGSLKCDCGEQLRGAIHQIHESGGGILLYLAQEGRGIGLINKLRAYGLQDQGFDTIQANERLGFDADERIFLPAARMLELLGITQVRLLTNNPNKVTGVERLGVKVIERVPHSFPSNAHNWFYLSTKRDKSGHLL